MAEQHKVCTKCHVDKVFDDFPNDISKKDGKKSRCKVCTQNACMESVNIAQHKVCTKCQIDKVFDDFPNDRSRKDGKKSMCKVCTKTACVERRQQNKQYIPDIDGKTKVCTKCLVEKALTEFYRENGTKNGFKPKCKICAEKIKTEYKKENKDKIRESAKRYRATERAKELQRKRRNENKEYFRMKSKEYYDAKKGSPELIAQRKRRRPQIREYARIRLKTNIQALLAARLRARFHSVLKQGKNRIPKRESAIVLVGCTLTELKEHLQRQFKEGMSWDNYGEWEIDHIRPIASFNLTDVEQHKICFNYANLQPLWSKENRQKGIKIIN
jgi:hypothetical protein